MKASDFISEEEKIAIVKAIQEAERKTSGEIRIHIDLHCKAEDVKDCATATFSKLGMHKTALRNGVLIYLAIQDKKFAIIGDAGINAVVPSNFWEDTKNIMLRYFQENKMAEGIIQGIHQVGEKLKIFFPYQSNDDNELSDEISFSK